MQNAKRKQGVFDAYKHRKEKISNASLDCCHGLSAGSQCSSQLLQHSRSWWAFLFMRRCDLHRGAVVGSGFRFLCRRCRLFLGGFALLPHADVRFFGNTWIASRRHFTLQSPSVSQSSGSRRIDRRYFGVFSHGCRLYNRPCVYLRHTSLCHCQAVV